MKSVGLVRKVDNLGRITLAKEDREILGIGEQDSVEMIRVGKEIKIKKYQQTCIICDEQLKLDNIKNVEGKCICNKCIKKIKEIIE